MNQLAVEELDVTFDDKRVLAEAEFGVKEGEFFCVVGPTNAGKSTLLKTIAGLVQPAKGTVTIKGRNVTNTQPKDRNVSLLFQNMALFPNLTGFENIAFPLRTAGTKESTIRDRVVELAEMLKVTHVLERLPRTFSGGEQQRVAIGRSIVKQTDLLMLDEPLTNLDARIRASLRIEFKEIHKKLGQTLIYVTHDQVEAMSMSDRIAVLHEGEFQQIGTPEEIYKKPANRFVAEFIGQPPMNILAAQMYHNDGVSGIEIAGLRFPVPGIKQINDYNILQDKLAIGVRPEDINVSASSSLGTPHHADILWVEHLGSKSILDLRFGGITLRVKVTPDNPIAKGKSAWFGFEPKPDHLLNYQTNMFYK